MAISPDGAPLWPHLERWHDFENTLGLTKPMLSSGSQMLVLGGVLTVAAALAHLACIAIGPAAYRFMGAGKRMVRAAEAGKAKPIVITLVISIVLVVWAMYAFSGAGVIGRLPFTPFALPAISFVFLARAVGFPLLRPIFPENSTSFWLLSSGICLVLSVLYAGGAVWVWEQQ